MKSPFSMAALMALAAGPSLMSSFLSVVPSMALRRAGNSSPLAVASSGLDGPVFVGAEGLDLGLAVAHEAQRHRLHAAGRAGARQLAPQHRRQGEADEIVEGAAGEIGVDQRAHRSGAARLSAARIACLVTALKATRSTGMSFFRAFFCSRICRMCQEMASPSRSGSVARMSLSAPFDGVGDLAS